MQIKEEISKDFFLYYNIMDKATKITPRTAKIIINFNMLLDLSFLFGPSIIYTPNI